jgi:hypothetical protein
MVACLGLLQSAGALAHNDLPARVHQAYSHLERLTARGKTPIKVTVAVLQVGNLDEIADQPYSQLVSLNSGYTTDLSIRNVGNALAYELEFRQETINTEGLIAGRPVGRFTLGEFWTAAQRLEAMVRAEELEEVDAKHLTESLFAPTGPPDGAPGKAYQDAAPPVSFFQRYARYRVEVQSGDLRLRYNALALHVVRPKPLTLFVDPVLWMIDRAPLDERRLSELVAVQAESELDFVSASDPLAKVSGICDTWTLEYHPPDWSDGPDVGTLHHINGQHSARVEAGYECSCDSSCNSTCIPLTVAEAREFGQILTRDDAGGGEIIGHRVVQDTISSGGHGQPGAGARCGVGAGACVKPCLAGILCTVTIAFGPVEVELPSFCMVSASLLKNADCRSCTLLQPPCPACTLPDGSRQECGRTVNCPLTRRNCGSCPLVGQVCDETVGSPTRGKCIIGCDGDNLCEPERGENCGNCLACRCPSGQSCNLFTQPPRCESNLPPPPVCGDGRCEGNENWSSCCFDCGCAGTGFPNDKVCQGLPPGQCVCTQPAIGNCGFAPNGCGELTYLGTCPSPQNCINNFCNGGGAPTCPNGICGPGENQSNCCRDCGCPLGFDCTGGGPGTCTGGGSCVPSDACTSGSTTLCAGTRWSNNCGRYVVCDITMCQPGQTCLFGACASPSGGGGNGGGNGDGGGGCECDPDGDGLVTEEECTQCCGGSIENNQCVA